MKTGQADVLNLLCRVPIQIFNEEAIKAGIQAWSWLLSQNSKLEIQFMTALADSWEWLVRRSRGIFSPNFQVDSTLSGKI